MGYKCPKCNTSNVWSITSRTADLGRYGKFSWIRFQCQSCGRVWVERIRLDDKPKQKQNRKNKSLL